MRRTPLPARCLHLALALSLVLAGAGVAAPAAAGTGYYLVTTYPDEGQRAVDFKYWASKLDGRVLLASPEIGLAYNVSARWYTELTAVGFKAGAATHRLVAAEWQNDFMLTQGEYPFDLAIHTNIERATDGSGEVGVEYGAVLQTEVGRTQFNANLFFQRELHGKVREPTELVYQWQIKYRWSEKLQGGVQGFGEVGQWNAWLPRAQQSHRAGPVLAGAWRLGGKQELRYEAALLAGTNAATRGKTFSTRLQFVF
ncbi:hypothetical protein [Massilia sp. DWR3-1-1]|uniref:hypothetical protein n=1 Tax=Massilia sp. DWR3-1-1 TaxID=2804559 RepID=UPI003CF18AE6